MLLCAGVGLAVAQMIVDGTTAMPVEMQLT
jgi:hypothetical protein